MRTRFCLAVCFAAANALPAQVEAQTDCGALRPQAEVSKEKEGKIRFGVDTLYKIAKGEALAEGRIREEIVNLQRGVTVSDDTLVALRTIYLFCGMVADAKDVSTERKVELYRIMLNIEAVPPSPPKKALRKHAAGRLPAKAVSATASASSAPAPICTRRVADAQASVPTEDRDSKRCNGRSPCSPDGKWWAFPAELTVSAAEGQELRNWHLECVGTGCTHLETMSVSPAPDSRSVTMKVKTWSLPVTLRLTAERWTVCGKGR